MLRGELLEYCKRDTKVLIELARALTLGRSAASAPYPLSCSVE